MPPRELSILDCGLRIANPGGGMCDLAICDLGVIRTLGEADAGWRSDDRHPGFVRLSAKLLSRPMESGPVPFAISHQQVPLNTPLTRP
jgi:hypothetical protein